MGDIRVNKNLEPRTFPVIEGRGANVPLSSIIQTVREPFPKDCFRNSFRAIPDLHSVVGGSRSEVLYSEGWAVHEAIPGLKIPIEHGWLEIRGKIVETTWPPLITESTQYFPVLSFPPRDLLPILKDQGNKMPVFRWFGGSWFPSDPYHPHSVQLSANLYAYGETHMKTVIEKTGVELVKTK
jgi:hypothetical protein